MCVAGRKRLSGIDGDAISMLDSSHLVATLDYQTLRHLACGNVNSIFNYLCGLQPHVVGVGNSKVSLWPSRDLG